jgi:hypothetical protein
MCSLMSKVFVGVPRHYSQFWCFEKVFSFSIFVLRLLCAPFSVPLPWLCVPFIGLVFLEIEYVYTRIYIYIYMHFNDILRTY